MHFRRATPTDHTAIWQILQSAIARRAADGSSQWQNGYPNADVVRTDIDNGFGHVLVDDDGGIGACCTIIVNDEPTYLTIVGRWLTAGDFVVVHRIAVAEPWLRRGLAQTILGHVEEVARARGIPAVRVDTKDDNTSMLRVFAKCGYTKCGEIVVDGSPRIAFEKIVAAR